jgi:hypothetical protein
MAIASKCMQCRHLLRTILALFQPQHWLSLQLNRRTRSEGTRRAQATLPVEVLAEDLKVRGKGLTTATVTCSDRAQQPGLAPFLQDVLDMDMPVLN